MAMSATVEHEKGTGEILRVAGPVVTATGLQPRMYDVMYVGTERLMGEVIQLRGEETVIQVYEEAAGLRDRGARVGEWLERTGPGGRLPAGGVAPGAPTDWYGRPTNQLRAILEAWAGAGFLGPARRAGPGATGRAPDVDPPPPPRNSPPRS